MKAKGPQAVSTLIIVACVAGFVVAAVGSSAHMTLVAPQGEIAKFRAIPAWYLSFKITIKGNATNSFSTGDASVTWKFDDSYEGTVALDSRVPYTGSAGQKSQMTPMEKAQAAMKQMNSVIQWAHLPGGVQRMGPLNGLMPLQVKINDAILSITPDPCNDPIKTTTTVNGNGGDFSYVMPAFMADMDKLSY